MGNREYLSSRTLWPCPGGALQLGDGTLLAPSLFVTHLAQKNESVRREMKTFQKMKSEYSKTLLKGHAQQSASSYHRRTYR